MTPYDVKHVKTESYHRWEQSNKPSAYIKQSLQHEVDAFLAHGCKITVLPSTARSGALDKP